MLSVTLFPPDPPRFGNRVIQSRVHRFAVSTNGLPHIGELPKYSMLVQPLIDFLDSPHALARNSYKHDGPSDQPTILQNCPRHQYQPC